jgi:hypothetical protein
VNNGEIAIVFTIQDNSNIASNLIVLSEECIRIMSELGATLDPRVHPYFLSLNKQLDVNFTEHCGEYQTQLSSSDVAIVTEQQAISFVSSTISASDRGVGYDIDMSWNLAIVFIISYEDI